VIDLLSLTLPIFLLIALGFVAVRARVVAADFVQGLGFFVLNFALPALVLNALLKQDVNETFNWNYVIAYAGGSLVVFLAALLVYLTWLRRGLSQAAIAGLGSVASNTGFVGFPVASLAIGTPALAALPQTMLVENVLVIPLALALAEIGLQQGQPPQTVAGQTLLRLSRTPLIIAIFLGVILSALGLHPPVAVSKAIEMVADASAACALFVVGGTLAGLKSESLAGDLLWILLGKLVFHPLAVGAGFLLVGDVPPLLMATGIIFASAPMLTVYPIFGQRFGLGGLCAAATVAATIAGFATMTVVIGIVMAGEAPTRLSLPTGASGEKPCVTAAAIDSTRTITEDCIQ